MSSFKQITLQQVSDGFQLVAVSHGVQPLAIRITMEPGVTFILHDSEEHPLDEPAFTTSLQDAFGYDCMQLDRPHADDPHLVHIVCA